MKEYIVMYNHYYDCDFFTTGTARFDSYEKAVEFSRQYGRQTEIRESDGKVVKPYGERA